MSQKILQVVMIVIFDEMQHFFVVLHGGNVIVVGPTRRFVEAIVSVFTLRL
jgi:hypothetical protein